MKNLRHKTRLLCLLLTILIINLGCAHHLPPLSEEVSANLGKIGVVTSDHYARLYFPKKPVTDWGEGCIGGVDIVIPDPPQTPSPDVLGYFIAMLFYAPIAAPIGCIAGVLSTESESEESGP